LALQVAAGPTRTVLASESGVLALKEQDRAEAEAELSALLQAWSTGMRQPLPVACRTAFADLTGKNAVAEYDGAWNRDGEARRPALARAYPSFAVLSAAATPDGLRFAAWRDRLYAPLWHALGSPRQGAEDQA
ncbi:MAG: hypothetical protein QM586_04825, partial [Xenophilus sp.]